MKRQGAWAWLAAAAMMVWAGCSTPPTCKTPGQTRSCECKKGQTGVQQCLPERVWGSCMCRAAGGPDAGSDAMPNIPMSGTGGTGPMGTGGSSMQPSMPMNMMDDEDADSGQMPMSTGGSGGHDAGGGTGGIAAGTGGSGGSDSGTPPVNADGYSNCSDASECKPAGSGCLTDATGLLGSACQPKCNGKSDCPVPAGSYSAVVTCNDEKLCVLDCSPTGSDVTPRSCPSGLDCHVLVDTSFACLTPVTE